MMPYRLSKKKYHMEQIFFKYPNKLVLGEPVLFQQCAEQMVDWLMKASQLALGRTLMETFTLRISGDMHKVVVIFFIFFYLPTCHMNVSWLSASAQKVQRKPPLQMCCTCASFWWRPRCSAWRNVNHPSSHVRSRCTSRCSCSESINMTASQTSMISEWILPI